MLGTLNYKNKSATVVGAGVSGLLIGYKLKKIGFDVEIHEASSRAGGLIQTLQTAYGPVEKAAHSLLVNPDVADFFQELNLKLVPLNRGSKSRFIVRDGKLCRMPLKFFELLSTLRHIFKKPALHGELKSMTFQEWGLSYLGPAATQYFIGPFTTGIFACAPSELVASLAFPVLVPDSPDLSLVEHMRSLKKRKTRSGKPQMMTLENGLQSLTDALASELRENIRLNSPVRSLNAFESRGNIVLTTPATVTAQLLEQEDSISSALLRKLRYSPLVTVTAFFDQGAFKNCPPRGVGCLIPRSENFRILGCLFNSSAFPNRARDNFVSLTVMIGGSSDPQAAEMSDFDIQELLSLELSQLIGVKAPAKHLEITRYKHAIPIFDSTLQKLRGTLSSGFCSREGKIIFSNFSSNISIRGMIESLCQIRPS